MEIEYRNICLFGDDQNSMFFSFGEGVSDNLNLRHLDEFWGNWLLIVNDVWWIVRSMQRFSLDMDVEIYPMQDVGMIVPGQWWCRHGWHAWRACQLTYGVDSFRLRAELHDFLHQLVCSELLDTVSNTFSYVKSILICMILPPSESTYKMGDTKKLPFQQETWW